MILRRAQPRDLTEMAAIDSQVSLRPLSEAQYTRFCQTGSGGNDWGLVCELEEGVAGFIICSRVLDEASIINIAVQPRLQGRGVGGLLLRRTLEELHTWGLLRCLLEVRESNNAAIALYRGEGFVLDGRRPRYYTTEQGDREDALLMSRQL